MSTDETKVTKAKADSRVGFKDGKALPGVDPDTGERVTAILAALKEEFGPKAGEMKFRQLGQLTGAIDALVPLENQAATIGGIQLVGLSKEMQFKANEILTAKE